MMDLKRYFDFDEDPDYFKWGARLDALLVEKYGLGVMDLPDQDYRSLYEDGMNEDEAFESVVEVLTNEWDW